MFCFQHQTPLEAAQLGRKGSRRSQRTVAAGGEYQGVGQKHSQLARPISGAL